MAVARTRRNLESVNYAEQAGEEDDKDEVGNYVKWVIFRT